jgi:hypothetical protein
VAADKLEHRVVKAMEDLALSVREIRSDIRELMTK